MTKRVWLTTAATILISTAAFAQSASREPSGSARQEQTGAASSTPAQSSPSSPASERASEASRPDSTPNADRGTPERRESERTNTGRAQNTAPGTNSTNAGAEKSQSGTAARDDVRPSSERAQSTQPASSQRQSDKAATGDSDDSRRSSEKATAPADRQDAKSAREEQRNAASGNDRGGAEASARIDDRQRTRVSESVARLNVQPLNDVRFSLSVGTSVPRDVRLQRLPADVVEIVPQYRDYEFVLVRDEIVIVDPASYRIVASLPYTGRSTAATTSHERRKVTFSESDREVVRKHVRAAPVERQTTGSTVRAEIRTGEPVPEGVEIEAFPEEVYRDAPDLREYRYIHRDTRTYIVVPEDRRVIEEID